MLLLQLARPPRRRSRKRFFPGSVIIGTDFGSLSERFCSGLRELGYVEGQNIAIEYWSADGNRDRLAETGSRLVAMLDVDVVVADGTGPSSRLKRLPAPSC